MFQLGRFKKVGGPGLLLFPGNQPMVGRDLRTVTLDLPTQDVMSRENVSVQVNAVIDFRVVDPARAIIQVENYVEATRQLAQTTLRSVLGQHALVNMLAERKRRAKVIRAEDELQASATLRQAASVLAQEPAAMPLRYLQTMAGIVSDRSSLLVFPLPMDLLESLRGPQARNTK